MEKKKYRQFNNESMMNYIIYCIYKYTYHQLYCYKPGITMRSFGTFTIALLGKAQRIKVAHWKRHTCQ